MLPPLSLCDSKWPIIEHLQEWEAHPLCSSDPKKPWTQIHPPRVRHSSVSCAHTLGAPCTPGQHLELRAGNTASFSLPFPCLITPGVGPIRVWDKDPGVSWGDVGVTQTPGSHSQREKVATWPSFHLSGCSKEKVSTGCQGLDRRSCRHEQRRQAASAHRAPASLLRI